MNRIICDICGIDYPETEESCPICGYPRQGTEKTIVAASAAADTSKVKGGRFSSKNVKKRQKAQRRAAGADRAQKEKSEKTPKSDKPLIITIVLLLVAIVLVSLYIFLRFFWGGNAFSSALPQTVPGTTTTPVVTTTAPTVPCAGIILANTVIDLDAPGKTWKLEPKLMPADTTDTLIFTSSDESVVRVSEDGVLTAVDSGQAMVTIYCGNAVKTCTVICWFPEPTTLPVETAAPVETTAPVATTAPVEDAVLTLDPADASCFSTGDVYTIYPRLGEASISRSKVTWTTSDPNVATVKDGVVTPVGKGVATITAKYDGKEATSTVRCRFETPAEQGGQENSTSSTWRASHSDVSISVGESFTLTVKNSSGETADAIWTMSIDGVVSIDGKTITGRDRGTVTLTAEVEGSTFTCIVRVK